MDRLQPLRERFPDFSVNLNLAIKATKASQPYLYQLFILSFQERDFLKLGKQINRIIWGRKRDEEKIILLQEAIIKFNCHLQRLRNLNHEDANLKPLYRLYNDFVELIPFMPVQLTIEFQLY